MEKYNIFALVLAALAIITIIAISIYWAFVIHWSVGVAAIAIWVAIYALKFLEDK